MTLDHEIIRNVPALPNLASVSIVLPYGFLESLLLLIGWMPPWNYRVALVALQSHGSEPSV